MEDKDEVKRFVTLSVARLDDTTFKRCRLKPGRPQQSRGQAAKQTQKHSRGQANIKIKIKKSRPSSSTTTGCRG